MTIIKYMYINMITFDDGKNTNKQFPVLHACVRVPYIVSVSLLFTYLMVLIR